MRCIFWLNLAIIVILVISPSFASSSSDRALPRRDGRQASCGFVPSQLPLRSAPTRTRSTSYKMAQSSRGNEDNAVLDFLKSSWIAVERLLVTITSGKEMAQAAATLEEQRLFGSRRLARAKNAIKSRLQKGTTEVNAFDVTAFSEGSAELSGGYKEGDGDDLVAGKPNNQDDRYNGAKLQNDYNKDTFKE